MRKYLISGAIIITAALGLALALHYWIVPDTVAKHLRAAVLSYGFETFVAQRTEIKPGTITFHKVHLDENEFTHIEKITLNYYTFNFLFSKEIERAIVEVPALAVDILNNGAISITGLPGGLPTSPFEGLTKIRIIKITEGTLDVFQNDLGSLRFKLNGESHIAASGHHEPQIRLNTAQKRFSADISMQGQIEPKGSWNFNFEINNANLETKNTSFNRITAAMNSSGTDLHGALITGELSIGSMRLFNSLWQNVNGTLELRKNHRSILLSGQNNKNENLELTLGYDSARPHFIRCALYGKSLDNLINFATDQGLAQNTKLPPTIQNMPEVTAQFEWPFSGNVIPEQIPLIISNYQYGIDLLYTVPLSSNKSSLADTAQITTAGTLASIPIGPDMVLENGTLKGSIPLDANNKAQKNISLILNNSELHLGALHIFIPKPLQINVPLGTLDTELQQVTAHLPLSADIKQHGLMDLSIKNARIDRIKQLHIDFLEGNILKLENVKSVPFQAQLEVRMLDLDDLFEAFPYRGINGLHGGLSGTLELEVGTDTILIKNGSLKSTSKGNISIDPHWVNLLFAGQDHDASATQKALRNFEFNSIEITIDGDILGTPTVAIDLSGHNPDMFEGQNFSMTLKVQKPLSHFFTPLLKRGNGN